SSSQQPHLSPLSSILIPIPPRSTLFPYTTLFRSMPLSDPDSRIHLRPLHRKSHRTRTENEDRQPAGFRHHGWRAGIQGTDGENRSEEHTSELQSRENLVCRLLLEKKKRKEAKKME